MSRTQNSILNFITNLGSSLLLVVLNFVTRSMFIRYLGTSYLGIEGLFSNILTMLSLAELGFGSAIVFKLYKPIEEQDRPRILVLMKLYRKTYFILGCVIAAVGICLIPFLPSLVKDYHRFADLGLNAVIIFLLYLFNSVASYWFFAYKSAFVQASQKTYLLNLLGYAVAIVNSICQILVLVFLRSFILYLSVQIFFAVLTNLLYALVCDKRYPYIREKTSERISKEELKEFFKDCASLLLYRGSNTITTASDNVVLSAMVGLETVGYYANYLSIKTALRSLLYTFLSAVQASLGSIYSTGNLEWSRLVFRVVNFCTVLLYGIGAIGLAVLMDDFIQLWIGSEYIVTSWLYNGQTVSTPIALLIGIEIFTYGQVLYCSIFRNAMGLFQELKFRPVASILVDLAICILTIPYLGIAGCVLSTIVSHLTTNLIFDPIVICKHGLKQSPWGYFLRNLSYKLVIILAGLLAWWVCGLIPFDGIAGFLLRGVVCVLVPSFSMVICFCRTTEFSFLLNTVKTLLHKGDAPKPENP